MFYGSQLRTLRQARGLLQKELASKMNIAQQRLSMLEQATKISVGCVGKALKALQFSEEDAVKLLDNLKELNKSY